MNPNTGTCPIFRSQRDAEINKAIYRRVPVLIREGTPEVNPWGISFLRMLHMANDSGLFRTRDELEADGWALDGNTFRRGDEAYLPLFEAKMVHRFDHRFGTYEGQTDAQANQGKLPELDDAQHADPGHTPCPGTGCPRRKSSPPARPLGPGWLLGWRDICRNTDTRTVIASLMPRVGVGHTFPLVLPGSRTVARRRCSVREPHAFVFDYVARQKIGGTHLDVTSCSSSSRSSAPDVYEQPAPWSPDSASRLAPSPRPRTDLHRLGPAAVRPRLRVRRPARSAGTTAAGSCSAANSTPPSSTSTASAATTSRTSSTPSRSSESGTRRSTASTGPSGSSLRSTTAWPTPSAPASPTRPSSTRPPPTPG